MSLLKIAAFFAITFATQISFAEVSFVVVANDAHGTPEIQSLRYQKVPVGSKVVESSCMSYDGDCRDREVTIYGKRPVLVVNYLSSFDSRPCDREIDQACDFFGKKDASINVVLELSDLSKDELALIEKKMSRKDNKALAQSLFKTSYATKKQTVYFWGGCEYTVDNNKVDPHCREVKMYKEASVKGISVDRK
jgi:hypothetical protein